MVALHAPHGLTLVDIYRQRCNTWSDIAGHLPFLHDTAVDIDAQVIVELGVRAGMSTAAFLAALEITDGHLWSVDVNRPAVPPEFDQSMRWTLLVADDMTVADQLPESIDVLFVDTSHLYEHTLAELRLYGPRVRSGGYILCHDTELETSPEWPPGQPPFPVAKALTAWCDEVGQTWWNRAGSFGLGVVTT